MSDTLICVICSKTAVYELTDEGPWYCAECLPVFLLPDVESGGIARIEEPVVVEPVVETVVEPTPAAPATKK